MTGPYWDNYENCYTIKEIRDSKMRQGSASTLPNKVVRVTATEFELSDGCIYQHPVPLDPVPTPEEFQKIYDHWSNIIK